MQQIIHDEISNKLKSIDKLRAAASTTDETICTKIREDKNRIAEMLKILSHLEELLQNNQQISIDSFLDLLTHKFNVLRTESSLNELLNISETPKLLPINFGSESSKYDISSEYLKDILRRCNGLLHEKLEDTVDKLGNMVTSEVVQSIVWPEVMSRLDIYLDHRTEIKVDLKRLTHEEEAMVESISNECVESIMDNLFHNK